MYKPRADRYDHMTYRHCGKNGILLPAISLGLWHNFGNITPLESSRACCARPSTAASLTLFSPWRFLITAYGGSVPAV